jgi:hypothetical protein
MKDIEEQMDALAQRLPKNYRVEFCVKQGSAWVQVMTPDLRRVDIESGGESCWAMVLADALTFALQDHECDHEWLWHATGAGNGYYCHKCDSYRRS